MQPKKKTAKNNANAKKSFLQVLWEKRNNPPPAWVHLAIAIIVAIIPGYSLYFAITDYLQASDASSNIFLNGLNVGFSERTTIFMIAIGVIGLLAAFRILRKNIAGYVLSILFTMLAILGSIVIFSPLINLELYSLMGVEPHPLYTALIQNVLVIFFIILGIILLALLLKMFKYIEAPKYYDWILFVLLVLAIPISFLSVDLSKINEEGNKLYFQISKINDKVSVVDTSLTMFIGKQVRLPLPKGWSVEEFVNGENLNETVLNGADFTGLSGLIVKNSSNQEVFRIEADINRGNEDEFCSEIYKFEDTPQSYIDGVSVKNREISQLPFTVVDLSSKSYGIIRVYSSGGSFVEYRRIGTTIFSSTNNFYRDEDQGFFPVCNKPGNVLSHLGFYYISESSLEFDYKLTYGQSVSEMDLQKSDLILTNISSSYIED